MRLISFEISAWKNLRDFSVDFTEDSATSVFVGRNATAKSNLLEALVVAFRDLDLGELPAFAYRLRYSCRGGQIEIDADPARSRSKALRILVDGKSISLDRFSRKGGGNWLPSNIFVYYSGHSDRMLTHFQKHEDQFDKELRAGKDQPLRPLLYVNLLHSKFALLAFFWNDDQERRRFLKRYLRIEDLDSVLFVLRRPYWFSSTRLRRGDPRFWGAEGVVRNLLDRLFRISFAPLRLSVQATRGRSFDRLYLYLPNKEQLQSFAAEYASGREFFKALDSMHVADLVEDVRARVQVRGVDSSLTFRELSEGEQQLLMVLGLLRFTQEEESLVLLDEPDTHLNPAWSLNYVSLITEAVSDGSDSHVVMATHDPLVVAGLRATQVYLMRRNQSGAIEVDHPERDPIGMGISALLMSDVYGLRSDLDAETLHKLDQRRQLATQDQLSHIDRQKLRELNEWVEEQDFTKVDRDPLYKQFVDAMTQWENDQGLQKQRLTKQEMEARSKMAIEIVRKLNSDDGAA